MKEEIVTRLKRLPHFDKLRFVYVYGSSVTGKVTKTSDIDVALYYDITDKYELHNLLFYISGSFPDKYDISMFQLLPLYVKIEVFKGELIYTDDKGFVHDIAWETIKEYNDFEPRYKYILYGKLGLEGDSL
ncbi:MAG: nucleotidyltransferase domain-containing protein [Theionarchaea archaeon]|nr:nucleotidyltransferase domain-containing protein [Theionarchaea archaeon]